MPISTEPGRDTVEVSLMIDEGKPKETRPTFIAKTQSMRGQREISRALDRMADASNYVAMFALALGFAIGFVALLLYVNHKLDEVPS